MNSRMHRLIAELHGIIQKLLEGTEQMEDEEILRLIAAKRKESRQRKEKSKENSVERKRVKIKMKIKIKIKLVSNHKFNLT